jgi:hypothetical protein
MPKGLVARGCSVHGRKEHMQAKDHKELVEALEAGGCTGLSCCIVYSHLGFS